MITIKYCCAIIFLLLSKSLVCMDDATRGVDNTIVFGIVFRNEYAMRDYNDSDAFNIRLVTLSACETLAAWKAKQIAAFQQKYKIDPQKGMFPDIKIPVPVHDTAINLDHPIVTFSNTYGLSGNFLYALTNSGDRVRCRITEEGILDASSVAVLESSKAIFGRMLTPEEFGRYKAQRMFTEEELFQGLVFKCNNTEHKLLLLNTPTKKSLVMRVPFTHIHTPFLEKNMFSIHGYTKLISEEQDILTTMMDRPWRVTVRDGGKDRLLTFYQYRIDKKSVASLLLHLFNKNSFEEKTTEYSLKELFDYGVYAPSFDDIRCTTRNFSPTKVCNPYLCSMCIAVCGCIHSTEFTIKSIPLLLEWAIILNRSLQAPSIESDMFTPEELHEGLKDLCNKILYAAIMRMYVSREDGKGTLRVNPEGEMTAPTLHKLNYSAGLRKLIGKNRRMFMRQAPERSTNSDDGDIDMSELPYETFEFNCKFCVKDTMPDAVDYINNVLEDIAKNYARSMWDNGTIGATWQFTLGYMSVSLYDFNAETDDPCIGTYQLPDIEHGVITNVIYKSGEIPHIFVDRKEVDHIVL